MTAARLYNVLIATFLGTSLALAQQTPRPQPPQPSPEERRAIEAEERRREAEEQQRLEQKLDQLQNLGVRVPLTLEEIEARRRKRLPQFLKNLEGFKVTSAQIASYASQGNLDGKAVKELRKKAKTLEGQVDEIVDYVMDGEDPPDPPDPPAADYASKPLTERISFLGSMAPSIHQRIKRSYETHTIDAADAVNLIHDLQSVKVLSRSLRKQ